MATSSLVGVPSSSGSSDDAIVQVSKLEKRYKKTVAVKDVSLTVHSGQVFGLIGPDGSGKSSLIRAIAGVQQYEGGRVEVFGQHVATERSAERVKSRLGMMPQGLGNHLYRDLTIDENIDYFAGLRLVPKDLLQQRKRRLLAMTRLADFRDRPMKQLSGGMKQKLGLVCTLIHEPELVLLDEPTTGVDPVSRRDFWAILAELVQESGMSVVVSTAYMDEAAYMDQMALMMDGTIVSQGKEADIKSLVAGKVITLTTPDPISVMDAVRVRFPNVESLGDVVRLVALDDEVAEASEWLCKSAKCDRTQLTYLEPDLEDVMADLLVRKRPTADGPASLDIASLNPESVRPLGTQPASVGSSDDARFSVRSESPPIQARNLVQDFGSFRAVDQVSFDVAEGRIFGLLGANGAGKTTVIKMLTGLLPPTSGHGSVAGADMNKAGQAIKERIGYMSQSFSLYTDLRAIENLEFYAGVYGLFPRARRQRIGEVLQMIGLEGYERRMTNDLPMGIRQRLALGCALVHRPRVVFLDEPTSGVDVLGRRQFWNILERLSRDEGVAILVTTHYMNEAERCDDLALMYAGRVIAAGPPRQLRGDLEREIGRSLTIVTTKPLPALRLVQANGFEHVALFGRSLRILTKHADQDEQRLRQLLQSHAIDTHQVNVEPVTMEDVFVNTVLAQEATQMSTH